MITPRNETVPLRDLRPERVPIADLQGRLSDVIGRGWRLGLMTAWRVPEACGHALILLVIDPAAGGAALWEALLDSPDGTFRSLTPCVPQAHWFERQITDLFGLRPIGHPRFKSVILHEAWPRGFYPLRDSKAQFPADGAPRDGYWFLRVEGDGVYEIPVGPIHAGIIEPGHFRFSCLGEVIENLEIRLGYQHRGIERQMTQIPWRRARFLAETISSDTTVGNAWAHAMAIENLCDIEAPPLALHLRALALEIERVASHIGDLGGICSDIGFSGGAAMFGILRGQALGLGERLTGSRLQTAFVLPGGVARGLTARHRASLAEEVGRLEAEFERVVPRLTENAGALERMEGTGRVRPSLAQDFGLVGPAGRASGVSYDVRQAFRLAPYDRLDWHVAGSEEGDVLARVQIRVDETCASLTMLTDLLAALPDGDCSVRLPAELPAGRVGAGIVEAWRGELIHLVFTDGGGNISRYCIKDPSFNNWTGLSIAGRGELVPDFPLCNKSFGLSYSGNDL